ncbi:MAG: HEAT repeat domain-containing protein, partial [Verrucomicrobia bacterium]|nr:HEAT repeat domain-containing protein [Verrucomicrobiota bacterium]
AGSKEHREVLERLRKEHRRHIRRTVDLGFLPESEAWSLFEGSSGWEMGQGGKAPVGPSQKAAAQVGMAKEEVFLKNLSSKDPNVRYWGAIGLTALNDKPSGKALKKLKATLKDTSAAVRIEAANALATHDDVKTALPALVKDLAHENLIVVTHAARTIELLGNKAASVAPQMKKALERAEIIRPPDLSPVIVLPGDKDLAMFVAFSCQAFLDGLSK